MRAVLLILLWMACGLFAFRFCMRDSMKRLEIDEYDYDLSDFWFMIFCTFGGLVSLFVVLISCIHFPSLYMKSDFAEKICRFIVGNRRNEK